MTQDAAPALKADGHLASNIIGENVYNGAGEDAEHIGDVNDIVLGTDGSIDAVIVGVGGFLGIGEKEVAVDFANLEWVERDGDRWLATPATKEQLEQQAAFDRSAYEAQVSVAASDPAAPGLAPAPPQRSSWSSRRRSTAAPMRRRFRSQRPTRPPPAWRRPPTARRRLLPSRPSRRRPRHRPRTRLPIRWPRRRLTIRRPTRRPTPRRRLPSTSRP
ncbi:PRC-barrel domain-containing protein [Mesorhizobium marinum]|uniref:PRC-barrel domain-containing protein n=1 Tax=Mesorhizobium marinum TaxID=3228790 RepID=UPI003F5B7EB0